MQLPNGRSWPGQQNSLWVLSSSREEIHGVRKCVCVCVNELYFPTQVDQHIQRWESALWSWVENGSAVSSPKDFLSSLGDEPLPALRSVALQRLLPKACSFSRTSMEASLRSLALFLIVGNGISPWMLVLLGNVLSHWCCGSDMQGLDPIFLLSSNLISLV